MIQPANFDYWDTVDEFATFEAAWLWCGLEPLVPSRWPLRPNSRPEPATPNLPSMGERMLIALRDAQPSLPKCKGFRHDCEIYSRETLRLWAEGYSSFRPRFLFPPPPARTDLTLDTALELIVILAKAADPRWIPGKPIPHGMASKLAKVAESLGLQLHRNTISKYLKEAGNKNISAL